MTTFSHNHWSHYDDDNELRVFNEIHALLVSGGDTTEKAKELADLSESYGYGEADSHLTDRIGRDPESLEWQAHEASYADYRNADYFNCIAASEMLLVAAAPDQNGRESAKSICQGARDAFLRGRQAREANDNTASPAP